MADITIWGYSIPSEWLSQTEVDYLKNLPQDLPTVDWVCKELDRVWSGFNLDNRRELLDQPIGDYYGHPVWLMNGIFSARDPISYSHRTAIAQHLERTGAKMVADYGGGFGELARLIAHTLDEAKVFIVEPYSSIVGVERLRSEFQIKFVPSLCEGGYDVIIAQDVLEHVEDPIKLAFDIASAVPIRGQVIFANCFLPVIQCHLPSAFHLRHTFTFVMRALGLRYVGNVDGAAHAQIYERVGALVFVRARQVETISRIVGPILNWGYTNMSRIKHIFHR